MVHLVSPTCLSPVQGLPDVANVTDDEISPRDADEPDGGDNVDDRSVIETYL